MGPWLAAIAGNRTMVQRRLDLESYHDSCTLETIKVDTMKISHLWRLPTARLSAETRVQRLVGF